MKKKYLFLLILISIPLVIYGQVTTFDFVDRDDELNITGNSHLKPPSLEKVLNFWKEPYEHLYIPLTYTLWSGLAALSQVEDGASPSPRLFHMANLIIHLLNGLLVFSILKLLARTYKGGSNFSEQRINGACAAAALFFSIHPLQAEPVSWATGMKDILSGFFSFLSIWQYLLFRDSLRTRASVSLKRNRSLSKFFPMNIHFALATLLYLLALLSKPSTIVLPFTILLLEWGIFKTRIIESLKSLSTWFLLAVPLALITKWSQPDQDIAYIASLWERPFIAGDALTFYMKSLTFPFSLAAYAYGRTPEKALEDYGFYFYGIIPLALFLFLAWGKKRTVPLTGFSLFVVALFPVLGFLPFGAQNFSTVSDRYLYFPLLGPSIVLSWFLITKSNKTIHLGVLALILLMTLITHRQVGYWKNSLTLFTRAVAVNPQNAVPHYSLGTVLYESGEIGNALLHLKKAVELDPEHPKAHNNLGALYKKTGDFPMAVTHYRKALAISPLFKEAHNNLATHFAEQQQWSKAITHVRKALEIDSQYAEGHNVLGIILGERGEWDKALHHFEKALELRTDFSNPHYGMGNLFVKKGELVKARNSFLKAVKRNPEYYEAFTNLGLVEARLGAGEEAIAYLKKALSIKGDYVEARYNLANLLAAQGRLKEAIGEYEKALLLPSSISAEIHNNLAIALANGGEKEKAIEHFSKALKINPQYRKARQYLDYLKSKER